MSNVSNSHQNIQAVVNELYERESRRVFATLIGLLGDFDMAEEAMHDAFVAAVEQWQRDGVPNNPRSWLVSTGRFKAIDSIRRRSRFNAAMTEVASQMEAQQWQRDQDSHDVSDDRLRLIFTCCHPALAPNTQVALTLREVCGLTTEEVAAAFLTSPTTVAQRIVRGKAKIRSAAIPYVVPEKAELPERLEAVLNVIYLVFNEGYSASSGDALTRRDLSEEAIRLGRLLVELLEDSEATGLLALMLIQESRRDTRATADGEIILLENQDRSRWNHSMIEEGRTLIKQAIGLGHIGTFTIQAAIAVEHASAANPTQTNWKQIVAWYDVLMQADPTPIVELNRAVAIAMLEGPARGLTLVEALITRGELAHYHLLHATHADLCRRTGQYARAQQSYAKALHLAKQTSERRFLERRFVEMEALNEK